MPHRQSVISYQLADLVQHELLAEARRIRRLREASQARTAESAVAALIRRILGAGCLGLGGRLPGASMARARLAATVVPAPPNGGS